MIKIVKIVKIIKKSNNVYGQYFPTNLITKMITHDDNIQSIFSINNHSWNPIKLIHTEFINATSQEQFLFYLNYEKPFVLEEKL